MKITKAQGRSCLYSMERSLKWGNSVATFDALDAIDELCGTDSWIMAGNLNHHLTALAMCAAISGVKP